uniref:EF-hand domain-containing protein n=1 Tax=Sparus aurata TaxID=8175 RepID=A0A671TVL8_SPAAU
MFEFLDKDNTGHLRPEDLETVPDLDMNPIGARIIGAFFPPGKETLDFGSFVRILAHFLPADSNRTRAGAQQEPANSTTGKLRLKLSDQNLKVHSICLPSCPGMILISLVCISCACYSYIVATIKFFFDHVMSGPPYFSIHVFFP